MSFYDVQQKLVDWNIKAYSNCFRLQGDTAMITGLCVLLLKKQFYHM